MVSGAITYNYKKAHYLIIIFFCYQFERDMMVWNNKRYVDNPILLKEDRMIKAYRNWFAQFYSENSRSYEEAKQTLEW